MREAISISGCSPLSTSPLGSGIGTVVGTAGAASAPTKSQVQGQRRGQGPQSISFLIKGTTSNPQFIPDVGGFVLQMLQGQFGVKP